MRFAAALIALLFSALPVMAAPTFPALTGRVVDGAHILSAATQSDLDQKLAALEAKTSRQLVVVTLPSLQGYEISDYGYQLGRAWGIGQAKLNNGVLLIVAPTEHKVRIEVGYGLEPILTDALSETIIQSAVLPKFRTGDFNAGVEAGVDALIQQLSLDPSAAEARAAAAEQQTQNGDQSGGVTPFSILIIIFFIAIAFSRIFGGFGFWPLMFLGGMGGGRGFGGYDGGGLAAAGLWRRRRRFWRRRRFGKLVMLSQSDHARIADAITKAESKTSGEIFCVLTHEVSRYREVPLAWAALAALLAPPVMVLMGLHRLALADVFSGWTDEGLRATEALILRTLSTYTLLQAGIFLVVALIVAIPKVRRVLTPRFLKRHRVRQVARHHFAASGARLNHADPHILIYASLRDRQVELVAHKAIHDAVGDGPWNEAVAAVGRGMKDGKPADGFVRAIEICGKALAMHFPPDGPPKNLLPNDILET